MSKAIHLERKHWLVILASAALLVLLAFAGKYIPGGVDWSWTFRPASLDLLAGRSPYQDQALKAPYAGAPWGLLPLLPLALLPESAGRGILFGISLVAFALAAIRMGARPLTLVVFLLSPPVWHCLLNANLDWLPLLGFSMPPMWGLFFLAVKPQMGSILALFWLVEAWRAGGLRQVVRVFAPVTLVLLVSLAVFGLWPLNMLKATEFTTYWNASLWPYSIPVGLVLTVAAIRRREPRYAMAASPCLSPHVLFHSWSGALITLVTSPPEMIAAVVGLWILVGMRAFSVNG